MTERDLMRKLKEYRDYLTANIESYDTLSRDMTSPELKGMVDVLWAVYSDARQKLENAFPELKY